MKSAFHNDMEKQVIGLQAVKGHETPEKGMQSSIIK